MLSGCLFPSPPFPSRRDSAVVSYLLGIEWWILYTLKFDCIPVFSNPLFLCPIFFSFFKMMLSKSSYDVHLKMAPGKDDIWSLSPHLKEKKKSFEKITSEWGFQMRNHMISFFLFFLLEFFLYFFFAVVVDVVGSGWGWSLREKTLIPCVTGMRRPVDSGKRQHENK